MTIELIITTIILGVLIFIICKKTNIKFQFGIDNKNQASIAESEENHIQKPSEKFPERPRKELGKNKWLYTTDNFGQMKKGRVQ